MGTFVAGPYAGSLLAELGADVIKVEPLGGDPFRVTGFVFNRGMRSLAINLAVPDGADAFRRLAAASDVVIDVAAARRHGQAGHRLRRARRRRTRASSTVSLSAYGEGGPLAGRPGVDMVLQAMSGMMSAQGGDSEPVANTIAIIDVTTGAMLALSTCLALLHRAARPARASGAWCSPGRHRHLPAERRDRPLRGPAAVPDRRPRLPRRRPLRPLLPDHRRLDPHPGGRAGAR